MPIFFPCEYKIHAIFANCYESEISNQKTTAVNNSPDGIPASRVIGRETQTGIRAPKPK